MNTDETPPCSTHPDAPHGFDRDGSHNAGRYVCDCEGWIPPEDSPPAAAPLAKPASPQGEDGERGGGEHGEAPCLAVYGPEPDSGLIGQCLLRHGHAGRHCDTSQDLFWRNEAEQPPQPEPQRCEFCEGSGFFSYNPNLNPNVFIGVASAKCTQCEGTGVMPSIGDHGVTEIVPGSAPEPPRAHPGPCGPDAGCDASCMDGAAYEKQTEPQSAVEWNPLCASTWRRIIEQNPGKAVQRALDLARRCDAAEAKHAHFIYRNERYKLLEKEADQLRTQLAAAQAEARELREALEALLEPQTKECRLDHHGYCQAHYLEPADSCCVAKARAALAKHAKEEPKNPVK